MSDNSNIVHFSDVRFIRLPHFASVSNDKMLAANEFYALKMNIIVPKFTYFV